MPGRKYQQGTSSYRYGFGGQEKSNEIKGEGNSYTAEFWEYDPRLVRRWNVDPVLKDWESPYAAFSNNPIINIDPHGNTDSTVTTPGGGNKVLDVSARAGDGGATNIKTFSGGKQNLKGAKTTVQPGAGTVSAFDYGGNTFNAYFNTSNGAFTGYNTIGKDGKLQSYDDFYKDYNSEVSPSAGEIFSSMKSVFKSAWYWGSPVKSFDTYASVQLKDKMSTGPLPLLGVEKSDVTWSILGGQIGYNSKSGSYGELGTFNNSYFNMGISDNHAARITPVAFSLFSFGNKGGGGDFNVQGRTLLTVAPFGKVLANQLDFTYDIHGKIGVGGRLKAEIPMGKLSGEAAIGYRYNLGWPRAFTNKWPSIFGNK